MPPRKKTEPVTTDAKDALDFDKVVDAGGTPNAPSTDDSPGNAVTPEQEELAALRAELAAVREREQAAKPADYKPIPEEELSPEQREIRQLKDQLARRNGKGSLGEEQVVDGDGGIVIHFLADGLTSNGRNFYRGQEVTFGPEAYAETQDRFGDSWLDLTEAEQFAKWKEVKFRKGPWPGERHYEEKGLENVSISEKAPVLNLSI
jgi:hypothetical protein